MNPSFLLFFFHLLTGITFEDLLGILQNLSLAKNSLTGFFSRREVENSFERKTKLRRR